MILSDKIVAAYVEGFSGVYIDCPKDKIDEIASEFNSKFEEAWTQAMDDAEEDYDAECQEKEDELEAPATAKNIGDRVFVEVGPLYLSMNYGARADNEYGTAALENTLKQLKESHPEITYEGVITGLEMGCFSSNEKIEEIMLPDTLKYIGKDCFENCPNLKKVIIPASVESFCEDDNTFSGSENVVIYTPAGSPAESFAKERNIKVIAL